MRVSLAGVVRSFGAHTVLDRVDLTLGPRSRLGLVGPNGAGKSTLLRLLAGLDEPDEGTVERTPATLTVGYLPQEHDRRPGETLLAYLARRTGVAAAEAEVERHTRGLEPRRVRGLARALPRARRRRSRAARATVCADLGLPVSLAQETATLSGGEAAPGRAGRDPALPLRRAPARRADERPRLRRARPARAVRRRASRAGSRSSRTTAPSSTGRSTRIAEIDPWTGRVHEYAGSWSDYAAARELARGSGSTPRSSTRRSSGARSRRCCTRGGTRRAQAAASSRMRPVAPTGAARRRCAGKVRQAERALERVEHVEKPYEPWQLHLSLAGSAQRPGDARRLARGRRRATRGGFRLGPVDLDLAPGERVAVTGRNGSGKSTLLALLLGELPLAAGRRKVGRTTVLGALDQRREAYDGRRGRCSMRSPRAAASPPVDARTLLAKFNLGADHVERPCATLSPGERTRAHLAELMARGVNCLVLDEPTNHLDLEAIEELETALAGLRGNARGRLARPRASSRPSRRPGRIDL